VSPPNLKRRRFCPLSVIGTGEGFPSWGRGENRPNFFGVA
jgi:hypothetical protein